MSDPVDRPPERLGARLKLAREEAGLSLSDLAQRTHVRRAYLEALEEGHYADLPEDVYTRNFVRLYGQALGLEPAPLLETYLRERRTVLGVTTMEFRLDRDRRAVGGAGPTPVGPVDRSPRRWPSWVFGPWLATLGLVIVVVGLAAWGFDRLFSTPPVTETTAEAGTEPGEQPAGSGAGLAAAPQGGSPDAVDRGPEVEAAAATSAGTIVRVDIVTEPAGAEITIDGFPLPGRTPLVDVPVTARAGRVVRAELDGHEPSEVLVDLLGDDQVELTLTPLGSTGGEPVAEVGTGRISLTITDATWLEVYRSSARNEGERLVFTTAQPGATYEFSLPVFVYVGNAAGARVNVGGQDLGPMGAPGAVLGRAFGP